MQTKNLNYDDKYCIVIIKTLIHIVNNNNTDDDSYTHDLSIIIL